MIYRWASTMGERYALPIMFAALEDAESHARLCQRLCGGLPGQDSMRLEFWDGTEWCPLAAEREQ